MTQNSTPDTPSSPTHHPIRVNGILPESTRILTGEIGVLALEILVEPTGLLTFLHFSKIMKFNSPRHLALSILFGLKKLRFRILNLLYTVHVLFGQTARALPPLDHWCRHISMTFASGKRYLVKILVWYVAVVDLEDFIVLCDLLLLSLS